MMVKHIVYTKRGVCWREKREDIRQAEELESLMSKAGVLKWFEHCAENTHK